jgi:hypothetical protein
MPSAAEPLDPRLVLAATRLAATVDVQASLLQSKAHTIRWESASAAMLRREADDLADLMRRCADQLRAALG